MKLLMTVMVLSGMVWAQDPVPPPSSNPAPAPAPASDTPPQPPPDAPAPVPAPAVQSEFPYWGQVTGTKVRVRGGAGDFHAILAEIDQGTPVRVLGKEGDWLKTEVPGGLAVYVALAGGTKSYVQENAPGEGVVMVDDLMVRGNASTEFPSLGRLMTGERVMILDKKDNFARILAPPSIKGFIHVHYVGRPADQAATGADFLARHRPAEEALFKSGQDSQALVAREDEKKRLSTMSEEAFSKFETEKAKGVEERDYGAVKESLSRIRDEAPAGHPDRARAEEMLGTVQEWEATRDDMAKARRRLEEAAKSAKDAEQKYARDLEDLRRRREEIEEAGRRGPARSPYVASGWIRRTPPTPGAVGQPESPFALQQGENTRTMILESSRYDLSEYADKLIGIVAGDGPSDRPGLALKVMNIVRLEILDG